MLTKAIKQIAKTVDRRLQGLMWVHSYQAICRIAENLHNSSCSIGVRNKSNSKAIAIKGKRSHRPKLSSNYVKQNPSMNNNSPAIQEYKEAAWMVWMEPIMSGLPRIPVAVIGYMYS